MPSTGLPFEHRQHMEALPSPARGAATFVPQTAPQGLWVLQMGDCWELTDTALAKLINILKYFNISACRYNVYLVCYFPKEVGMHEHAHVQHEF